MRTLTLSLMACLCLLLPPMLARADSQKMPRTSTLRLLLSKSDMMRVREIQTEYKAKRQPLNDQLRHLRVEEAEKIMAIVKSALADKPTQK